MSAAPYEQDPTAPMYAAPPHPRPPLWVSAVRVVTAVGVIATAALVGVGLSRLTGFEKLVAERLEAIEAGARARAAAEYVTPDKVELTCFASNNDVTCTATNRGAAPIATCVRGKLAKKQAAAVAIYSVPFCTGRLGQYETKTLSAQWKGAFAKDICSSKTSFGTEMLDFGECDFTTEAVGAQPAAMTP